MTIPDSMLKNILEAHEFLQLKNEADPNHPRGREQTEEPSFGFAHRMYVLGLEELMRGNAEGARPVGLRVYESVGGDLVAFYDVAESGDGSVRAMSESRAHLDAFVAAAAQAESVLDAQGDDQHPGATEGKPKAGTRLLRIPALNFEGLWATDRGGHSIIVPLQTVGSLLAENAYPMNEALSALREAGQPIADMDDTMGA